MSKRDTFREMFGDKLADQVELLKRKTCGVEVLKPRPKRAADTDSAPVEDTESPYWWDR